MRQRQALSILALLAAGILVRMALPLGMGLLLGVLLAFVEQPLYRRLVAQRRRRSPIALLCSIGMTLVVAALLFGLGYLLVTRGVALLNELPQAFSPGGPLHAVVERMSSLLQTLHLDVAQLAEKARDSAVAAASKGAEIAATVAGATFGSFVTLLFMTMSNFYVLLHWDEIVRRAEEDLPFKPEHTRALFNEFQDVGRKTLFGTVAAGLIQGLFAGIGYWITGVPAPAFFGALTAVASLIPAIGTVLVWATIGVLQILTGHVVGGIVDLVYGALVVGVLTDYVIRPKLVGGGDGHVPAILTFIGLLGGTEVFGLPGLILGPVVVALCVAILNIYHEELPEPEKAVPP